MKTIPLLVLLCLTTSLSVAQTSTTLIASGTSWQYLVASGAPASTWKSDLGFNDTSAPWYGGPSPLGYGGQGPSAISVASEGGTCVNQCVSGTATTPSCLTCAAKEITTYFRKTINVTNVSSSTFTMHYQRDDGLVIYVNGIERVRENLPAFPTTISHSTTATAFPSDADEVAWVPVSIAAGWLQEGQNLIAVEVHQLSPTSSDIRFNMQLVQSQAASPVSSTFISGANWQYLVTSSDPLATWKSDLGFNDTSTPWYGGPSPFGYGGQGPGSPSIVSEGGTCVNQCVSGTATTPSCLTCAAKSITTYFRKTINLTNVSSSSFTMQYQRDDGLVIYINGIERVRENLPTSPTYSTTATAIPDDAEELVWKPVTVQAGWLQEGLNLIAVEVHQTASFSSDIRFNMELQQQNLGTPIITRGPYLQLGGQTAATIRWRTNVPTVGRVTYGLATSALSGNVAELGSTTEHEIRITGLVADKQYFYSVGTSTTVLEQGANNYFLTAPLSDTKRKIRIASFGDCGNNEVDNNQSKVRDGFLAYRGNTPTDLWMLIGDNSYDGDDPTYQTKFFNPYKDNLLKNCMLYTVPGNHDYNDNRGNEARSRGGTVSGPVTGTVTVAAFPAFAYFQNFTLPTTFNSHSSVQANTEEWYSFDYGPIHFVMLDSYGTQEVGGVEKRLDIGTDNHPQIQWLKADLAATTKKWKIVYMHFPPYTKGSHNSDTEADLIPLRTTLNPILEGFGVDLVLTGHSHGYERSFPIHDQYEPTSSSLISASNISTYRYPGDESTGRYESSTSCAYKNTSAKTKQGTIYVVTGSAGALTQNPPTTNHIVMATDYSVKGKGGSFYMEIEDNRLDAKFLQTTPSSSFSIADQFTIMKDVDIVQTLTLNTGQSATLTASFISDYVWSSPGNLSFTAPASRTVVVSPTTSQTFVVKDSKQCIQDMFVVQICSGPLYSVKAGNWDDPTVWSCNRIPLSNDHVQVKHNILVPTNLQAHALKVQFDPNTKLTYGANARLLLSQ